MLRGTLHLVDCDCLHVATHLITLHTSFVLAGEAHVGGVSRLVYNFVKKKTTVLVLHIITE